MIIGGFFEKEIFEGRFVANEWKLQPETYASVYIIFTKQDCRHSGRAVNPPLKGRMRETVRGLLNETRSIKTGVPYDGAIIYLK